MPRELTSKEQVEKLLPVAREIRLVRGKKKTKDNNENDKGEEAAENQQVKMKLRTEATLYTFKTTEEEAQALIKGQKIDIVEY